MLRNSKKRLFVVTAVLLTSLIGAGSAFAEGVRQGIVQYDVTVIPFQSLSNAIVTPVLSNKFANDSANTLVVVSEVLSPDKQKKYVTVTVDYLASKDIPAKYSYEEDNGATGGVWSGTLKRTKIVQYGSNYTSTVTYEGSIYKQLKSAN